MLTIVFFKKVYTCAFWDSDAALSVYCLKCCLCSCSAPFQKLWQGSGSCLPWDTDWTLSDQPVCGPRAADQPVSNKLCLAASARQEKTGKKKKTTLVYFYKAHLLLVHTEQVRMMSYDPLIYFFDWNIWNNELFYTCSLWFCFPCTHAPSLTTLFFRAPLWTCYSFYNNTWKQTPAGFFRGFASLLWTIFLGLK